MQGEEFDGSCEQWSQLSASDCASVSWTTTSPDLCMVRTLLHLHSINICCFMSWPCLPPLPDKYMLKLLISKHPLKNKITLSLHFSLSLLPKPTTCFSQTRAKAIYFLHLFLFFCNLAVSESPNQNKCCLFFVFLNFCPNIPRVSTTKSNFCFDSIFSCN